MSVSHRFLHLARRIHLYVGVFIAPALLFFAFTGGLQVFSLHETTRGSDYKPPAWLVTLAQVHKKQTTVVQSRKGHGPDGDSHRPTPMPAATASVGGAVANPMAALPVHSDDAPSASRNPLPLKVFFALVALGLFVSTLIGLYMAYRYTRKPALVSIILLAGLLLPIVLALL